MVASSHLSPFRDMDVPWDAAHTPRTKVLRTLGMGSRRRVLVVDDHSVAADSVVKLLRLMGHEASAVYSGQSALDVAPLLKPDVIFVDLMMPVMNGLQLARQLKQMPGVKAQLIALTAYSKSRLADESGEVGFDGFIPKPATADALEWTLSHSALLE